MSFDPFLLAIVLSIPLLFTAFDHQHILTTKEIVPFRF